MNWDLVLECNDVDFALSIFVKLFSTICDKHAPMTKDTVRKIKAPWLDDELRESYLRCLQWHQVALLFGKSIELAGTK